MRDPRDPHDRAEIRALAASGAVAGLCPLTEASLGDGIFDGADYLAAGGRFGIGTDSNIQIDAAAELRQLEYGQRLARRARNVMTLREGESTGRRLFASALAAGAQALQQPIGALAAGLRADIVLLDTDHPDLAARSGDQWLDAWIFVAGRAAVRSVLVGGEGRRGGGPPPDAAGDRGPLQERCFKHFSRSRHDACGGRARIATA